MAAARIAQFNRLESYIYVYESTGHATFFIQTDLAHAIGPVQIVHAGDRNGPR
jgi:hypothetical protein